MSAQPLSAEQTTDIPAAVDFLRRRFDDTHAGFAVLAFIKDGNTQHGYVNLQAPDRWERARLIIGRYAGTHDSYVAAAVFSDTVRKNATTGKNEYRTTDMIAFVTALYIERDDHAYPDTMPPSSYTVETSKGNYQDYLTLDKPTDAETAARYLRRIAAACGLGNQAVDAARLLRLPGTINRKPDRAGEMVRVVDETEIVYSLGDFDHLPDIAPMPMKNGTAATGDKVRFVPGERRPALLRIAGAMRRVGADQDAIHAALEHANENQCDPPLDDEEVQALARDIPARYAPAPPDPVRKNGHREEPIPLRSVDPETGEIIESRALTDYGNAERLVQYHGEDLRFCHPFGKWLAWDGGRWQIDNTAEVMRRAKQTARRVYQEAADATDPAKAKELAKHAIRSESDARLRAMIGLAESEPGVPILPEQLDADLWIFNVENGTIDLKTGSVRPHDRGDLVTKIAPVTYDPDVACPTFDAFLARILPSKPLRRFVQRVVGYALTGDTREDAIFINYGDGNNGKSTLIETVQALMGDYAMQTPVETLLVKRGEGIPNDVARLRGARFVAAAEGDEGRRLAEGLIKQLTGGDKVTARFLHGEFFEFPPTFKIALSTNHKPIIRGTDEGIWRRIRLTPFGVTIPKEERDPDLPKKLHDELPGILNWAIAGCLAWQQDGLGMPEEIEQAVKSYREEMSPLQEFVEDRCIIEPDLWQSSADLWDAYQRWSAQAEGRRSVQKKDFPGHLRAFGCLPDKVRRVAGRNVRGWQGIGLRAPDGTQPPAQQNFDTDDPGDTPGDDATAATAVTAFPGYLSAKNLQGEKAGNAVTSRSSRSGESESGVI